MIIRLDSFNPYYRMSLVALSPVFLAQYSSITPNKNIFTVSTYFYPHLFYFIHALSPKKEN